jgi:formyltetrahydrofolate deformylase
MVRSVGNRHHPRIAGQPHTSRLLLACPDQPGLIAAVSGFLADAGLNIVDADQHSSDEGRFFMRMAFDAAPEGEREDLQRRFEQEIAAPFEMDCRFAESSARKRLAIMVSREDHCLSDLLWRWRSGELGAELVAVVSNHANHAAQVESLGLPFHHVPVDPGTRDEAEARTLELVAGVDLLVLARYMQVLSAGFLEGLGAPAINIHHSFLPAFIGADPYGRAHERGVKLIGATAHYVTEELDAGPIIDQDVTRVSHRGQRPTADRPRHRAPRPRPRRQGPHRRPRPPRRRPHHRLLAFPTGDFAFCSPHARIKTKSPLAVWPAESI